MDLFNWSQPVVLFDERRNLVIPGNKDETIDYCVKQLVQIAQNAIIERGLFTIALSGGGTPNEIYKRLASAPYRDQLDWTKVLFFWSDERSVPKDHPESNYRNSLAAGLGSLEIPPANFIRMVAEDEIEENALKYENLVKELVPDFAFDIVMLGMGEDGHTASLFPHTHALHTTNRLVVSNFIPQKHTWRMTFTYDLIHHARHILIYVIGKPKAQMVEKVLYGSYHPEEFPIQKIGTAKHKALWIMDNDASHLMEHHMNGTQKD